MWFVYFYSASIVVCLLVDILLSISMSNRAKREGYKKGGKKSTIAELIASFLPFMIPFINLALLFFTILVQEELYKRTVQKLIDREYLIKEDTNEKT
jgi:hypothetical protein